MPFNLADAYEPAVWKALMAEKTKAAWSLANSAVVKAVADLKLIAEGPSRSAELPFFRDIAEQDDEPQVERTAPTKQGIGTGKQIIKKMLRVIANDASAEARDLGHEDPLGTFLDRRVNRRLANTQKKIVAILTGVFGTALAANGVDHFAETANSDTDKVWQEDYFFDAASTLGILQFDLEGGAVFVHPVVYAAMQKADAITFVKPSEGKAFIATWKGLPIYLDKSLVRNGTTSGKVYSSYIIAAGAFGSGLADQPFYDIGAKFNPSVSHFAIDGNMDLNTLTIYDRTAEIVHLDGTSYTGTVAGESVTNAELATADKWAVAYDSAEKVPVVRIRTNG